MTAPVRPNPAKTFGRVKVVYTSTIASYLTALTAAEATAAGNLDISCYLMSDWGRPTQNTNRVQYARRVCDTAQYESIGTTNYTGGDLRYSIDPQAALASNAKKAFEKFPEGTTGYFIERLALAVATDLAATQFVNVWPIELGPQLVLPSSDGEDGEAIVMQTFGISAPPKFQLAIT